MADRDSRRWLPAGVLVGTLVLGGTFASGASAAEAWDDGHMQSRFGGPRSGPLQAPPLEGGNGFAPLPHSETAPTLVREQWLAGSQHPWTGRATGLSNSRPGASSPRGESRPSTRHTRNPGTWSRTGQTSGLRGSSVRRSSGGR
jgi:hypothetical protein